MLSFLFFLCSELLKSVFLVGYRFFILLCCVICDVGLIRACYCYIVTPSFLSSFCLIYVMFIISKNDQLPSALKISHRTNTHLVVLMLSYTYVVIKEGSSVYNFSTRSQVTKLGTVLLIKYKLNNFSLEFCKFLQSIL